MNSQINYYRINTNNTTIATSNAGAVGGLSPTEELAPPTAAGTYSTGDGTTTITNQTVGGFSTLSVGQYLYYIDSGTGEYVLMGQIESIASPATTVTLSANSTGSPAVADVLAGSFSLITITESIYIRIATQASGTTNIVIPDFSQWRTNGNNDTGTNNSDITSLEQISSVGSPISPATAIQIPFTIRTMNNFTYGTGNNSNRAWPQTTDFPSYIWIRATPATTASTLASKTMYRWTTQDSFNGATWGAGANGPTVNQLIALGYNTTGSTSVSSGSGSGA